MSDAPAFLHRPRPRGHASLESGVRDIIAKLNATADAEVCEVLAGATNLFSAAIIRFRGNSVFTAGDISQLMTIWQILLDVKQLPEPDYASGRSVGAGQSTEERTE